jgi:hypothetical protein
METAVVSIDVSSQPPQTLRRTSGVQVASFSRLPLNIVHYLMMEFYVDSFPPSHGLVV